MQETSKRFSAVQIYFITHFYHQLLEAGTIFKSKLYAERNKPPSYYNITCLSYRLRLECSSLNSHLFKKNIVESPQCSCGAAETSKHYLLNCPNYTILCNQILYNCLHMPIKLLLSSDPQLSGEENEQNI